MISGGVSGGAVEQPVTPIRSSTANSPAVTLGRHTHGCAYRAGPCAGPCVAPCTAESRTRYNPPVMKHLVFLSTVIMTLTLVSCISMIHRSVDRDDLQGVRKEVEAGTSLEATDYRNRTPLQLAAEQGRMEIVRYLVEAGAEVDATTDVRTGEVTPLRYAITNNDIEMVLYLIEHGADVNHTNERGWTPLMTAARHGHSDIIDILLAEGADIYARTASGRTITRIASDAGYTDVVLKLTLLMQED